MTDIDAAVVAPTVGGLPSREGLVEREWTPADDNLEAPFDWEPSLVTVTPDLFRLDTNLIIKTYVVMAETPQHTYRVLTAAPKKAVAILSPTLMDSPLADRLWPVPNVQLGVPLTSFDHDYRLDFLKDVPAAFRWVTTNLPPDEVSNLKLVGWIDEVVYTDHDPSPPRPTKEDEVAAARHLPLGHQMVLDGRDGVSVYAEVTGFDTLEDGTVQVMLTGLSLQPEQPSQPESEPSSAGQPESSRSLLAKVALLLIRMNFLGKWRKRSTHSTEPTPSPNSQ